MEGSSKTFKVEWAAMGQKVPDICVFIEAYDDGKLISVPILMNITIRSELEAGSDRFFLAINRHAPHQHDFFKRQPMDKNQFVSALKNACLAKEITYSGKQVWISTHDLRGPLAILLFKNIHTDLSEAFPTGRRDPRLLQSYQHLQGGEGLKQQRDLLGNSAIEPTSKRMRTDCPAALQGDGNCSHAEAGKAANIGSVSGGTVNHTVNYIGKSSGRNQ